MGARRQAARIAVVADHELVAAGVRALLGNDAVVSGLSWPEFSQSTPGSYDVVLVDPEPVGARLPSLADVVGTHAGPTVVFTWCPSPAGAAYANTSGAAGYLSKSLPAQQLLAALTRIRAGEQVVALTGPDDASGESWLGREAGLSRRESEIVALITQGVSNLEIAEVTNLSINSVKSYIRSAYAKMPAATRAQAVRWAMEHGFVPDASPDPRAQVG